MPLFSRRALHEDLLLYRRQLSAYYGTDEGLLKQLHLVWRLLAERGNLLSTFIEEGAEPTSRVPVHTLAGVFVSSEFAQSLESKPGMRLGSLVASDVLCNGGGVLDLQGIRRDQLGHGLHFLVIHGHFFQPDPGDIRFYQAKEMASKTLFQSMRGYHVQSLYREVGLDESVQWLQNGGMKIVERAASDLSRSASWEDPILMRVTREDAEREPGSRMASMFVEYQPIFGLKSNFRELVAVALNGSTDKQIAEHLSLSVPAVKRRWERLYVHIEASYPELWRSWAGESVDSARGSERRRHLLNYFRDHPEELRPWVD